METLNKTQPLVKPSVRKEFTEQDIETYLKEQFPAAAGEDIRVVHLWAINYRIKVYIRRRKGNNIQKHAVLDRRIFVQVKDVDGKLTHKVLPD